MSIFKIKDEAKSLKITNDTVKAAYETLNRYKRGKSALESRIIENEEWWRLRHYQKNDTTPSAWLFNSIINKHADAMDNLPTVSCLPREERDTNAAKLISDVLPVILEENSFEHTYSECWYDKLKSGTSCYGVFWNSSLEGGLGNVDIRRVDLLNLFWEPGITDIQASKNVFHVELWDNEALATKYPQLSDCLSTPVFDTSKYIYDDAVDTCDKSCVIDWYYKKKEGSEERVHFCKFCNGILLYASENDELYSQCGFYNHGKYPFVLDKLYPLQGSPCGFGIIDTMRGTQAEIDALSSAITKNARMAAERRYFVRQDGALNEKEFADFTRPFVHYQGSGDPNSSIMPITTPVLSDVYVAILNNKIEELKETSGNRDFSQGGVSSGVTAASAIAALQEAGSKLTRDMVKGGFRAFSELNILAVELIRQFYDEPRFFRILGDNGQQQFISYDNSQIKLQKKSMGLGEELSVRKPIFDIKVCAEKASPFSKISQNELALQLYSAGMFNPENRAQALLAINMMDFEGKSALAAKLSSGVSLV